MQQPQTYTIEGILYEKLPAYHGEKIVTREFILKILRYTKDKVEYYGFPKFKCIKWPNTRSNFDTVKQLEDFYATSETREGDILKVTFQLDGTSYQGKDGKKGYMTSLVVKKIELLTEFTKPAKKEEPSTTEQVNEIMDVFNTDETEVLPF
jgi:hypothetical protein